MSQFLAETRKNTTYLLHHIVKVVELWECQWKDMRKDGRKKVSRRRVSSSTSRKVEDDTRADLDRHAHRYYVRYDRMRVHVSKE